MGSRKAGLAAVLSVLVLAFSSEAVAAPVTTPTTTSLALSSGATVASGTVVTFVASVNSGSVNSGAAKLTQGQVRLCEAAAASCSDIHQLGTAQLTSAGTARFRFVPGIGSHSYKAVFAGTPGGTPAYTASASPVVSLTVTGRLATSTATTITAEGAPGNYTLSARVSGVVTRPGLAAPTGTVSFLDTTTGSAVLGTSPVGSATSGLTMLGGSNAPLTISPSVITAADFNGDGLSDLVVGNYNSSGVLLDVLLGSGDGNFTPVSSLPTSGHYTLCTAVGDYNGDGIPDLAVANGADYTVTILLGNGDGTFSTAPGPISITAQAMVTGDFNGDGIADLATAEGYAVSIFLGKGDGTFVDGGRNSWPGVNPLYLAVGDFNGDGRTDLAVTDTAVSSAVFLLLNNGDGTFSKTGLSPATGFHPGGIAAGDLNGDGSLDVVLAEYDADSNNGLTVLLGNGDGTFGAPESYPASRTRWRSVVVADFNGDGIPDLATAQDFGNSIAVLLGNGDGTFGNAILMGAGGQYSTGHLTSADFNGDGIPDLAVPDGGKVDVLLTEPTQATTATVAGVLLAPGTYQVVASYPGDSLFQPSVSPTASVTYTAPVPPPAPPSLFGLSPAITSAGSQGFTLTVNGSGFSATSTILWGATPLTTQFVSSNVLMAQVPASDVAAAGAIPVTVQAPAPGGVSNALQFEVDSKTTGSTVPPVFTPAAATIAAGATATYQVALPSNATSVSATCLNLPSGATCSYVAASGAVTIATLPTTPAGSYIVTVVFAETQPGVAAALLLLPILLLSLPSPGKKASLRPFRSTALLGFMLLLAGASITACGGSSSSAPPQTATPSQASHQLTSSATVILTIQ